MIDLKRKLLSGDKFLGVWGTGYIGFSTMTYFASNGVHCIGTDVEKSIVDEINAGKIPVPNLEYWIGFKAEKLVRTGMIRATEDWRELIDENVGVHVVSVPTEDEEKPWDDALRDVILKISDVKNIDFDIQPLVIVESTLAPGKTDKLVIPIFRDQGLVPGKDIYLGVAPRRDWFISPEKNLKTLPRVIGGTTPETTQLMKEVLGIVCENLISATDHRHAEMVKCIENAYRHVEITLANQLSLAYPDINMIEVLKLVGTKWNVGTYHPSFGTGGYCIPLSSQYALSGTTRPQYLSILKDTLQFDSSLPFVIADSIAQRGIKKVGILGLAYKGDIKVHVLSPTLRFVKRLKERGIMVKVNDPYFTPEEIRQIASTDTFEFPEGLREFEAILIVAGHREYRSTPSNIILENLKNCRIVVDNVEETWSKIDFSNYGVEYHVAGDGGWLPVDDNRRIN